MGAKFLFFMLENHSIIVHLVIISSLNEFIIAKGIEIKKANKISETTNTVVLL